MIADETRDDRANAAARRASRINAVFRHIGLWFLLLVAYLVLEWFSFLHQFRGLPVSPWNPGLGVVFAFMLVRGLSYGWLLFAALLLSEVVLLKPDTVWYIVVVISAISALGYTIFAALIRLVIAEPIEIDRTRDVIWLAIGGTAGAFIISLVLSFLFVPGEREQQGILLQMFIGDAVGIVVMGPLTLRLMQADFHTWLYTESRSRLAEILLHVLALGVTLAIISQEGVGGYYLLFVPIVITAVRFGFDGACVAVATVHFALGAMLHIQGADVGIFFDFQTSLLALTMAGLFVGAEVNARKRSEKLVKQAEAEIVEMRAAAARTGRLVLVESMGSSLAHEINQPMTAARAHLRSAQVLLTAKKPDYERAESNLGTAIAQIDHAANVLKRMREFLKRRHLTRTDVTVKELFEETLLLTRGMASRHTRIDVDKKQGNLRVYVDRVQIQQVFLNLIRNALESLESTPPVRGRVHISASRQSHPERVEFVVRDNGPGVAEERRHNLFEPMQTTKEQGLGLGLAICVTIVEAHGGRIWLERAGPGDTEFRFWVPAETEE